MLEAMLQAMLQFLEKMKQRDQELNQQILARVHRVVLQEMEKNISDQLRKQISERNISSIEYSDRSGNSIKFHLVDDPKNGQRHTFQRLKGDQLVFHRSDGKGDPVYLDIKELDRVLPALEGRIAAMRTLSNQDEKQVLQNLLGAIEKAKREGLSFSEAYQKIMGEKVKHEIRQSRQIDLNTCKKYKDFFNKRQNEIELELDKIKLQKMDLETKRDAGLITKKEYKTQVKDLDKIRTKLTKELKMLVKARNKFDKQLGKEMEKHCLGLSAKSLNFDEKITLAESAFKQPEGLNREELRQALTNQGDTKALQALDKAEGQTLTQEINTEKTVESTFSIQ